MSTLIMNRMVLGAAMVLIAGGTRADVIRPDLPAGTKYQMVFVTAGKRNAYPLNMDDYNTFVAHEAALSSSLPAGITWHALGSVWRVSARDNAPTYDSIPIYNTHGQLVANGSTDLWDSSIANPIAYDQYGDVHSLDPMFGDSVATGTDYHGYYSSGNNLGIGYSPFMGKFTATDYGWSTAYNGGFDPGYEYPFYALSSSITVPEPSPLLLLGMGAFGLLARVWRRGWKAV